MYQDFEIGKQSSEFQVALTDAGLCQVLNGDAMRSSFTSTQRIEELSKALDIRDTFKPEKIKGSGKIYEKTFWIDIGDRYDH